MGEKERGKRKLEMENPNGNRQPLLVKYQGRIFDVAEFAPKHPGTFSLNINMEKFIFKAVPN